MADNYTKTEHLEDESGIWSYSKVKTSLKKERKKRKLLQSCLKEARNSKRLT